MTLETNMTPTQKLIEDGIKGGWRPDCEVFGLYNGEWVEIEWAEHRQCMLGNRAGAFGEGWQDVYNGLVMDDPEDIEGILLDPDFMRAVGKTRGWGEWVYEYNFTDYPQHRWSAGDKVENPNIMLDKQPEWQFHMHRMIDALAEGKSLTEFIESL